MSSVYLKVQKLADNLTNIRIMIKLLGAKDVGRSKYAPEE